MTRHEGPDWEVVPDELRCEAMIRGKPSYNWQWMRVDHRCPRKANQTRMGRSVCWQHGAIKLKKLKFWEGTPSPRSQEKDDD